MGDRGGRQRPLAGGQIGLGGGDAPVEPDHVHAELGLGPAGELQLGQGTGLAGGGLVDPLRQALELLGDLGPPLVVGLPRSRLWHRRRRHRRRREHQGQSDRRRPDLHIRNSRPIGTTGPSKARRPGLL
ncbi:MAG: hypothetical protein KY450_12275 [Actinobacteria bacterium]|nr:hypothetical protein [Actinomycetota bacterium]